jgi:hypothetical protein
MVLGGGTFGRLPVPKGFALMGISEFMKEYSCLSEEAGAEYAGTMILEFSAPRTERNK